MSNMPTWFLKIYVLFGSSLLFWILGGKAWFMRERTRWKDMLTLFFLGDRISLIELFLAPVGENS